MVGIVPPRRFDPALPEMVDLPDPDPELLRGEMRNLRIINRRFGGLSPVREILELSKMADPGRQLEILDLATGSADVPVRIMNSLKETGPAASVTAVDRNERVLDEARTFTAGVQGITLVRGDILGLGYPDRSFDISVCSLALHHFTVPDAVRVLREMHRLSRIGYVVVELRRSYAALAGAWLYTRLTTRNVMTRADALASVRAAYTRSELERMLGEAGAGDAVVRRTPVFRLAATVVRR